MLNHYECESPMEVYPVRMQPAHAINAREIGGGNLSEGVRIAIEEAASRRVEEKAEKLRLSNGVK